MTVGAQQDIDLGPIGPDGADQAAHKARPSTPLGRLPGRNSALTKLAVEHNAEAVVIVVGIEQAEPLTAMQPVERVVDIEHNAVRHGTKQPQYFRPEPG
jgi:hypothetical protein